MLKKYNPRLYLTNISFADTMVYFTDFRIYIQDCEFSGKTKLFVGVNVTLEDFRYYRTKILIQNCQWFCHADCDALVTESDGKDHNEGNCLPSCALVVDSVLNQYRTTSFRLRHTTFVDTVVSVTLRLRKKVEKVTVNNLSFKSGHIPTPGGLYVNIILEASLEHELNFYINDSDFAHISTAVPDLHSLDVGALKINISSVGLGWYKNIIFHFTGLVFEGNHRALSVEGKPVISLHIRDSVFTDNYALQSEGAAMHLRITGDGVSLYPPIEITNCSFRNNMAGFIPSEKMQNERIVSYDQGLVKVRQNGSVVQELALFGKGGAVAAMEGGTTDIKDCVFVNNSARNFGGSIYATADVQDLTLMDTVFEKVGAQIAEHGDVLYVLSSLLIHQASFQVDTSLAHVPIIQQSQSQINSLSIQNFSVLCPIGFAVDVDKTTALNPELFDEDQTYSFGSEQDFQYLDRITITCTPCKRGMYSIDRGLLVVRTDPSASEVVEFEHRDVTCRHCPYGGICEDEIRSVPNYWGYVTGNEIVMKHCIQGQCCNNDPCPGYHNCAANRGGILCSECIPGYSHATFSQECVQTENCRIWWFWPGTLCLGITYGLFLLFQDDIIERSLNVLKRIGGIEQPSKKTKNNKIIEVATVAEWANTKTHLETNDQTKNDAAPQKHGAEVAQNNSPDYLQILVNFIQDAALFYVFMPNTEAEGQSLILRLFGFTLAVVSFIDNACFLEHMSPVQLLLVKSVVGPTLILMYLVMYWVFDIIRVRPNNSWSYKIYFAFRSRLPSAFMLTLLFSFQNLFISSLTLLGCIEIDGRRLLKIDTTVECYQNWQFVVLGYIVSCSLPFPVLLMIVPDLLQRNLISERSTLHSGIIPLPFMITWIVKKIKNNSLVPVQQKRRTGKSNNHRTTVIYHLLQGPYRDILVPGFGPVCWTGITMSKRLVLCVVFTFVSNSLIRVVVLMLVNLFGMLQLFYHHPYKQMNGNRAELLLSGALLMIGMANVVRAAFESAQYIPKGPDKSLIDLIDKAEFVLLQWVPLVLGGLALSYVFLRGAVVQLQKKYA